MNVTATVTGAGTASCVPDNPTAVDAEIFIDGEYAFDVTMVEGTYAHAPGFRTYGFDPHGWCSDPEAYIASSVTVEQIEAAVQRAVDSLLAA